MATLARPLVLLCLACLGLGFLGCAGSQPSPSRKGFYYTVKAGDNLYRIGKRFRVPADVLVRVNRIGDVTQLAVGQRVYIPARSRRASAPRSTKHSELHRSVRAEARRGAKLSFAWPLARTKLTSRFGRRKSHPHEGIDLASKQGTAIRAAESGKVIHAGRLGAYGKVVILKHAGNYRSVYAHARRLLVRKGQFVERSQKIAEVGMTGRTTGPHLHFEIRRKDVPKDPLLYLP